MKKDEVLKKIIGFSQEEMALLLKIPKSQWSMFKSGKRSLPVEALKQFGAMLEYHKSDKPMVSTLEDFKKDEHQKAQLLLKREQLRLQVKVHKMEKKIAALEKQRAESFSALETLAFLETGSKPDLQLLKTIRSRVLATLKRNSLPGLHDLEIKKEGAAHLMKVVEEKLAAIK